MKKTVPTSVVFCHFNRILGNRGNTWIERLKDWCIIDYFTDRRKIVHRNDSKYTQPFNHFLFKKKNQKKNVHIFHFRLVIRYYQNSSVFHSQISGMLKIVCVCGQSKKKKDENNLSLSVFSVKQILVVCLFFVCFKVIVAQNICTTINQFSMYNWWFQCCL